MSDPRITVVYPLYRAEGTVDGLVEAIARQRPPEGADPDGWMRVLFIDDASPDATIPRLRAALDGAGIAGDVQVVENEQNLGLARNLNRALGMVDTAHVLTCHVDCRFGSDDYVARALGLLEGNPDVGAIAGQSTADLDAGLSRAEKVYLAANLMDVFPAEGDDLMPVGFAEGRCDAFRMEALEAVGFYDTTLRTAGEDQILASRLRDAGYRVCQAPALQYHLSVSSSQDSLRKLVRHARLFGRMHPYLLFASDGTLAGAAGAAAGGNRTRRSLLRGLQLAGGTMWGVLAVALLARRGRAPAAAAVAATQVAKAGLFRRYVRDLDFDAGDTAALAIIQPALDVSYTAGFLKGLLMLLRRDGRTIA